MDRTWHEKPPEDSRQIAGWPEGYRVTPQGKVWSCRLRLHEKEMWREMRGHQGSGDNPYPSVTIKVDGRAVRKLIHTIVLETFVGPCPDGMEACHYPDPDPRNNNVDNLRWDTPKANREDSRKHGTLLIGEACPWAKLTEDVVREIKRRSANGDSAPRISSDLRVKLSRVENVLRPNNPTWKHVRV